MDGKSYSSNVTGTPTFSQQFQQSSFCRYCLNKEESAAHVVLECAGVSTQREQILNTRMSLHQPENSDDPRKLLNFSEELGLSRSHPLLSPNAEQGVHIHIVSARCAQTGAPKAKA